MTLKLQATAVEVMRAVDALQRFGRARGVPEKALFGLTLALEECGSNVVNYALRDEPGQTFQVSFEHTMDAVTIELRDRGPQFDPTPAMNRPVANHDESHGGWGLPLVRRYMDEIRYRREDGENVLQLVKRLNGATAPT